MARLARLTVGGYVHHVSAHGNNGQPIFGPDGADQPFLLALLGDGARRFGVALHAYVLLGNAVHLLLTPPDDKALPALMQALGRRYVRYFNDTHQRSGTLWEGRYRCTLIQPERHLLDSMVTLDLAPVHAGAVAQVGNYPWSSHGHYTGQRRDPLVTPHAVYWALGNTPFSREAAYGAAVQAGTGLPAPAPPGRSLPSQWALGDADFLAQLQKCTPRRVSQARPGRPVKASPQR